MARHRSHLRKSQHTHHTMRKVPAPEDGLPIVVEEDRLRDGLWLLIEIERLF